MVYAWKGLAKEECSLFVPQNITTIFNNKSDWSWCVFLKPKISSRCHQTHSLKASGECFSVQCVLFSWSLPPTFTSPLLPSSSHPPSLPSFSFLIITWRWYACLFFFFLARHYFCLLPFKIQLRMCLQKPFREPQVLGDGYIWPPFFISHWPLHELLTMFVVCLLIKLWVREMSLTWSFYGAYTHCKHNWLMERHSIYKQTQKVKPGNVIDFCIKETQLYNSWAFLQPTSIRCSKLCTSCDYARRLQVKFLFT